jgi:hypothetical protein
MTAHGFNAEAKPRHSVFYFPAGNACINENGFLVVTDVVTIPIASRIDGGYE